MLQESDQERKEIRGKYIALGEKVEVLLNQERHNKSNADRDTEAAKMAVKEAVADLEAVGKHCMVFVALAKRQYHPVGDLTCDGRGVPAMKVHKQNCTE